VSRAASADACVCVVENRALGIAMGGAQAVVADAPCWNERACVESPLTGPASC
jgi:hypothetical protein